MSPCLSLFSKATYSHFLEHLMILHSYLEPVQLQQYFLVVAYPIPTWSLLAQAIHHISVSRPSLDLRQLMKLQFLAFQWFHLVSFYLYADFFSSHQHFVFEQQTFILIFDSDFFLFQLNQNVLLLFMPHCTYLNNQFFDA